jgi:2-polyprenyl-3-methyl-5-hydroxy-6-metoxy-1,4-benzoquinol methylase
MGLKNVSRSRLKFLSYSLKIMSQEIIQEQIAYYKARAKEYDEWFDRIGRYDRGEKLNQIWFNEAAIVRKELQKLGKFATILELACGTGIWTQELIKMGKEITAIDASQETLDINRDKINSFQVNYQQLDLFSWQPNKQYNLVFFAFWLSHIPLEKIDEFFKKVYRAVRPSGKVFLIDSRFSESSSAKKDVHQTRKLNDGREFKIFKIYYQPEELLEKLTNAGFQTDVKITDNYFLYAQGLKL